MIFENPGNNAKFAGFMKHAIFVILSAIVILVGGCDRRGREIDHTLDLADALMTDRPDSALTLVQSIDTTGLSQARIARYALLLTQAQDKNYIFPEGDALIRKAVEYYCGMDNEEEIAVLYYYGNILYNNQTYNEALPVLAKTYEMAYEKKIWFYAGMSARLLADIYDKFLLFPSQIKYLHLSKNAFLKYEQDYNISDNRYSKWLDTSISEYLVNTDQYHRCLQFCDSIENTREWLSDDYRDIILINKAEAYCGIGKPEKGVSIYDSLINFGYKMEGYNWNRLSRYQFYNNNINKSREALDSAKSNINSEQDILYIAYLENLHASYDKDRSHTLESMSELNRTLIKTIHERITSSPIPDLITSYEAEASYRKLKTRKHKSMIIALSLTILGILIIGIVLFQGRARQLHDRGIEIVRLNEYQEIMEKKLTALNKTLVEMSKENDENGQKLKELQISLDRFVWENRNLTDQLKSMEAIKECSKETGRSETLNSNQEEKEIYGEIKKKINKTLRQLDDICKELYLIPSNIDSFDRQSSTFMNDRLNIRSDLALEYYDHIIDLYSCGFIDNFQQNFPTMKKSTLRLVRYMYVGFCIETIQYLRACEDRKKIIDAKSKLKKRILEKTDWINLNKKTVIRMLKIKD